MGFLCCDAKSYFKSLEFSDCRYHVRCVLPFRSWSVIGCQVLCCSFLACMLSICCIVLFTYKIFVNFVFSHDLVLVFIAKALLFSSVIFKSHSLLSWVAQSVDVARWMRPAIEHAQDVLSGGLCRAGMRV